MDMIYFKDRSDVNIDLDNGWKVYFKGHLYIQDPDEVEPKIIVGHNNKVIGLMSFDDEGFVSVDKDNIMIAWTSRGNKELTIDLQSRIIGLKKIDDLYFITITEDEKVSLWSKKRKDKIVEFNVKVDSFENILIDNGFISFLTEDGNLDLFELNGQKLISFQNQKRFFEDMKNFSNGCWLTKLDYKTTIWSKDGIVLSNIPESFSFSSHFLKLNDKYFAFLNNKNEIHVYSFDGKNYSSYANSFKLYDMVIDFIKMEKLFKKKSRCENDILDFLYENNPSGKKRYKSSAILEKHDIKLDSSEKKYLWNFFNRPIYERISSLFKEEEKSAKVFRKEMNEKKDIDETRLEDTFLSIKKTRSLKKIYGLLLPVSFIFAVLIFTVGYNQITSDSILVNQIFSKIVEYKLNVTAASLILFLILFIMWILKDLKLKVLFDLKEKYKYKIKTLSLIELKVFGFLKDVKIYRESIIKQMPIVQHNSLYSGFKVKNIINNKIYGEIQETAMSECGIDKNEILYTGYLNNHEAIVLHDWSMIQDKENDPIAKNMIRHNELSFWSTKKHGIIFAVEYIQYIFVTQDKIDVFGTYYDFITDTYISKRSSAYYYKDVTNISKKEVAREIDSKNDFYSATQITLQVSSGDSIKLTITNPKTIQNLQKHFNKYNNSEKKEAVLMDFRDKLKDIILDDSIDAKERKDRLQMYKGQINAVESNEIVLDETSNQNRNKADKIVESIRMQVHTHKVNSFTVTIQHPTKQTAQKLLRKEYYDRTRSYRFLQKQSRSSS